MKKSIRFVVFLTLVALSATSCITKKSLTYLREVQPASADSINKHFVPSAEITIKPADELTIFVNALDMEAVAPYNLPTVSFNDPTSVQVKTTPMLLTYRVDENGKFIAESSDESVGVFGGVLTLVGVVDEHGVLKLIDQ